MDSFEHDNLEIKKSENHPLPETSPAETVAEEPIPSSTEYTFQREAAAYRGTGAGRKESPYADSPYAMNYHPHADTRNSYQQPTYPPYPPEAPKKAKTPKKHNCFWRRAIAVLLIIALVAGGCLITAVSVNNYWENRNALMAEQMNQKISSLQKQIDNLSGRTSGHSTSGSPVSGDGLTPAQVYAQNVNSVVAISSTVQATMYGQITEGASSGSGFILTEDGYVVTNHHVIEGATAVNVVMHNGTEYPAEVIGSDAANDLAVLKVDAENLPAATLGSSDDLIIGDMVVAIGNPLGELTATQTVGYVSGKDRDVTTDGTIISMIQTDAAINPGNSGGPLFNMKGEVVGVTTAKYSGTTNSGASIEGIGFAIPIDDVLGILHDLKDYGYVTGAYLGVSVQNTDETSAAMFGLPSGAYVRTVEDGSAADRAGVQPKDIIIDLGGHEVTGITTLTRALRDFNAGDVTTITVIRSGMQLTLNITLDEKPQTTSTVTPEQDSSMPSEGSYDEWYEFFRRYFGG